MARNSFTAGLSRSAGSTREGIAFGVRLEIAAGAKRLLAGAGDHDGANLRGCVRLRDAGAKAIEHGLVERIAPLLPVDGEPKRLPFSLAAHVRHRFPPY